MIKKYLEHTFIHITALRPIYNWVKSLVIFTTRQYNKMFANSGLITFITALSILRNNNTSVIIFCNNPLKAKIYLSSDMFRVQQFFFFIANLKRKITQFIKVDIMTVTWHHSQLSVRLLHETANRVIWQLIYAEWGGRGLRKAEKKGKSYNENIIFQHAPVRYRSSLFWFRNCGNLFYKYDVVKLALDF